MAGNQGCCQRVAVNIAMGKSRLFPIECEGKKVGGELNNKYVVLTIRIRVTLCHITIGMGQHGSRQHIFTGRALVKTNDIDGIRKVPE